MQKKKRWNKEKYERWKASGVIVVVIVVVVVVVVVVVGVVVCLFLP